MPTVMYAVAGCGGAVARCDMAAHVGDSADALARHMGLAPVLSLTCPGPCKNERLADCHVRLHNGGIVALWMWGGRVG